MLRLLFIFLAMCSCQTIEEMGLWTSDQGIPLKKFAAKDGSYFPPYISKFFVGSGTFQERHPTLEQARRGLKLIEVKQLNQKPEDHNEANLSWSADGAYLGFEITSHKFRKILLGNLQGDYARDLFLIPNGEQNFLEGIVNQATHSYNASLRWSKDSTRYAFMSNGGTGNYNIYVGAIGVEEKPVAKSPTKDGYAVWAPNSSDIAFVSARSGNGDIYVINLEDRDVLRLSSTPDVDLFPEWSPDGRKIVYCSGDANNHDIKYVERPTAQDKAWFPVRSLTNTTMDELRPTVSPSGEYVAFYGSEQNFEEGKPSTIWNIYVVPFRKGNPFGMDELSKMVVARDVVVDLNTGPSWTPDSQKLFYVKRDPEKFNPIYGFDLAQGQTYLLNTRTRMNRDLMMSKLGVLSFRAQVGAWDRVFVALTNQGSQLQKSTKIRTIRYL